MTGPVVLLHPLGGSASFWTPVVGLLEESGWTDSEVISLDLLGHGAAPELRAGATLSAITDQVARTIGGRSGHPDSRAVIVGISLGGLVAQDLAVRYPDLVDSLVLCDTVTTYPPGMRAMWTERAAAARRDGLAALVELTSRTWFSEEFAADPIAVRSLRDLVRTDPEGYARTCEVLAEVDLSPGLAALDVPTLVVCGVDDGAAFIDQAHHFRREVSGATLLWLEGRHAAVLEDADTFVTGLVGFLQLRRTRSLDSAP
jgi:3-oxoadipate enol-lactonase